MQCLIFTIFKSQLYTQRDLNGDLCNELVMHYASKIYSLCMSVGPLLYNKTVASALMLPIRSRQNEKDIAENLSWHNNSVERVCANDIIDKSVSSSDTREIKFQFLSKNRQRYISRHIMSALFDDITN